MEKDKQASRIKRGHMTLMKHRATALYSGVMLMGTSEVLDDVPTAYTDGVNKRYGRKFLQSIANDSKVRGLILHENLHIALKHVTHGKAMFEENAKLANIAADFVVNDVIAEIRDCLPNSNERLVELPDGAFYDMHFHNWSMRAVYNYLKKECKSPSQGVGNGGGKPDKNSSPSSSGDQGKGTVVVNGKEYDLDDTDEHDFKPVTAEEAKAIEDAIESALREGGLLAGRMGGNMPRVIADLLTPKVDWREALREFVSASTKGKDEFTWRRMNKRQMANDIYLPSVEDETVGEVIVAIDTSGSIGSHEITEFATELVSICELVNPEKVRILWWDTKVHGEQVFVDNYGAIAKLLRPLGGGGTRASSVSEHINQEKLNAECVLMFTDGYLEDDLKWGITTPTLWMVTRNKNFEPPIGKKVFFNNEE